MGVCTVVLKSGVTFLGKRGFKEQIFEAWGARNYTILASNQIATGRMITGPHGSISYIVNEPKAEVAKLTAKN